MLNKEMMRSDVISYKDGARMFAGRDDLYEKYLRKFVRDTHFQDALTALEKGNYVEVLNNIHPLKGITGTLGMNAYFETCYQVVSAIRQERFTVLEELLQEAGDERSRVLKMLEQVIE